MAVKHNNQLPNVHLRKDWQRRVSTWFNQPGRKQRRRLNRVKKAAAAAPRPVDGLLRPAVRCPTIKYNIKVRAGRGFTLEELKAAGIPKKEARTIGIAVDHRRRNKSEESLNANVHRLKAYRARLIVFPRRSNRVKKGDASAEDLKAASQLPAGSLLPITTPVPHVAARAVTQTERETSAYRTLRVARADKRYRGILEKRAREKAEEEANKVKK
ncbi:MAG: 50S ribosomal protein L13e [Piptocephalis tieghemiana]|nr:MAG: 50S ribosomal protein L13e [Piptocephalis tieghemiana]